MTTISASVGKGGTNVGSDVLAVQTLVNQCLRLLQPLGRVPANGACDQATIAAIMEFQRRVLKASAPDGRIDPGGHTLQALELCAAGKPYPPVAATPSAPVPAPSPVIVATPAVAPEDRKYSDDPNEVVTRRTSPSAQEVVAMLQPTWPELGSQGARTLAAQFMVETGSGKYCFNWNLGNVKAKSTEPHMYLRRVWEVLAPDRAHAEIAGAGALGHIATRDEIKQNGWFCPDDKLVAVFMPPHAQCRFRAYPSLREGAQGWLGHHQKIAQSDAEYMRALERGDADAAARALKRARYYTADEDKYALGMTRAKAEIDHALGAG